MFRHLLITGGTGFLGRHILKILKGNERLALYITVFSRNPPSSDPTSPVRYVQTDLRKTDSVYRVCETLRYVDLLLDASSLTPYGPGGIRHSEQELRETNVVGVRTLLGCLSAPPKRMVYVSSCDVYGTFGSEPVSERSETHPQTPYAQTKLEAENLYKKFAFKHEVDLAILRLSSLYGPGDPSNKVIPAFAKQALAGETLPVAGDGKSYRNFLYVEDAARACVEALRQESWKGYFNVVNDKSHSVLDVVSGLGQALGKELKVKYTAPDKMENRIFAPSALEEKGYKVAKTSLEEGLRKTLQGK